MRAITYTQFGAAFDVLDLQDIPTPTPAPGEVLVRLKSSGVNPSDVKARAGSRPGVTKPPFPMIIPHSDGAGDIVAVGDGVSASHKGQRVWIWNGQWQRAFGTAAEYIALPADQAVPLPDATTYAEGATLGIPGITAVHTVLGGGPVEGKTLLISGGAGVVGHLAIQVALASGARVLATARGGAGLASAKSAGAETVFDYTSANLADEILQATNGALIDRIIEVEFGQNADTNATVITPNGTICAYGSAKDMTPVMPFYPLMFKAVTLDLALIYLLTPAQRNAATTALTTLIASKAIQPRIAATLPLEDCAKAHGLIENGPRAGSVILDIAG